MKPTIATIKREFSAMVGDVKYGIYKARRPSQACKKIMNKIFQKTGVTNVNIDVVDNITNKVYRYECVIKDIEPYYLYLGNSQILISHKVIVKKIYD